MYNGHAPARCVIVEEPAQKQLRFRYECEGRSAGSIPGANSTPDSKTYPTIKIEGFVGRGAVVVVSCVTKDEPYRPHPHKLVGREGCKKGVCTVNIPEDTMTVSFPNLGIQCVKKKDIEDALKTREEIRVDPFRTGFSHRASPTSIDLNAVRLCFQVFLPNKGKSKFQDLEPVVSQPIYDKKAMSDLIIVRLSDSVCPVDGGNKDIILLCEKVTREDIQVRFYEEKDGRVTWEANGEFQPTQVHKQTAIWFRPPRYKTLEVTEPVKMYIQLRRPSDGATSVSLPFQMVSLGRPAPWSLRPFAKKRKNSIFSEILAQDTLLLSKRPNLFDVKPTESVSVETQTLENNNNDAHVFSKQSSLSTAKPNQTILIETKTVESNNNDDISQMVRLENETIEQLECDISELDKIYLGNNNQLSDICIDADVKPAEYFDDTKSYSSLQLAFKNPLDIAIEDTKYEDVVIGQGPIINIIQKEEEQVEKLPPLPPKRLKKGDIRTCSSKITDINDPSPNVSREHLIGLNETDLPILHSRNLSRHRSQELNAPIRELPPTPCSTLPKSKKRKFLSGLFSHFSKSASNSREATPSNRASFASSNSLQIRDNLNRSASNISQAGSFHIPLKESGDLNSNNVEDSSNGNLVPDVDFTDMDLTEAEHYALYTTMAPHATQSEFDETSCYYAPVEGGKILSNADMQLKLNLSKT